MHSNGFHLRAWSTMLIAVAALVAAAPAFAAEPAGRVLITTGTVNAIDRDGFERPLSRNDVVYPGETLHTGPDGRLQVRFRDDALLDLQPSTELEIERYRQATEREGGSAVMNLLRGAMRTITGAIGKGADDEYAVDTPVATIGVRGTDYSLEFCDAACAGNARAPGLYGRVDDGSIIAQTGAGTTPFATGDYFFVPQGGAPLRIIAPPAGILIDDEDEESEGESVSEDEVQGVTITEGDEAGGELGDANENSTVVNTITDPDFVAGADPRFSPVSIGTFAVAFIARSEERKDSADLYDLEAIDARYDANGHLRYLSDGIRTFSINDTSVEGGSFESDSFSVDWGRWSPVYSLDDTLVTGGMVYASTQDLMPTANIDQLRATDTTVVFTNLAGSSATDAGGSSWSVDSMTLSLDFGAMDVVVGDFLVSSNNTDEDVYFASNQRSQLIFVDGQFKGVLKGGNWRGNGDVLGNANGEFEGALLGPHADGSLISFQIDSDELEKYVNGIVVLED